MDFSDCKGLGLEIFEKNGFPKDQGVIAKPEFTQVKDNKNLLDDFANMMAKLSLQEKEFVRLKFFEEFSDFDVAYVTGGDAATISQQILRVIKRVHLLLFGASDDSSMFFAKVSGELSKVRVMEDILVDENFKLDVKADVARRIMANDFAIDVEVDDKKERYKDAKGSNDPAKIFVEAVREMREEQQNEFDDIERMNSFFERFGAIIVALFIFIFVLFLGLSAYKYYTNNVKLIVRGYPTICDNVDFDRDFNDTERRYLNIEISDVLCENYDVEELDYKRVSRNNVNFKLETDEFLREYEVEKYDGNWYVRKYERTANSN